MMNKNKKKVEEMRSQEELNRTFKHIPEEALRALFRSVTEIEIDRWTTKDVNGQESDKGSYLSSANNVKFPAQIFINILQTFDDLRRGLSLDIIAKQNALNHELNELLNKIATLVSRTYIELGDGAEFADDEALLMIRDLLLAFDSTIIHRTRFRQITSEYKSGYKFGKSK
jgi:hypothetical protein